MSKKTQDYPPDLWLHVATDALARYAQGGGGLRVIEEHDGDGARIVIVLENIEATDPRFARAFAALVITEEHNETQPA